MDTRIQQKHIIIVGAGFGGLAAAAFLGKAGYKVTILEKNESVGGRARVYESDGFTFDMGPSWYLMPDVFERFFGLFGKKPSDYMDLRLLDPQYTVHYEGGKVVTVGTDLEKNLALFETLEPGSSQRLRAYFNTVRRMYELATNPKEGFLYKYFNTFFDFINPRLFSLVWFARIYESFHDMVARFTRNDKIQKILEYPTVFLGGSPSNVPSVYTMMSHADFGIGGWYPMGGMGKLVEAMTTLATSYGVSVRTDAEVARVVIDDDNKATGVELVSGEIVCADVVLINADMHHAETKLIPLSHQTYSASYWESRIISPSTFLIYLGIRGRVKGLSHHNLILAEHWNDHFKTIFENPSWPQNPSYYVSCPSKTDPSVAPEGDENIFILVPVAAGLTSDESERERIATTIIDHLEKTLDESIRSRIIHKRVYAHQEFMTDYHAFMGTAFGPAHTFWQTALFRPHNKSAKVSNVYYTGHYTQPGIGMPMVVISGELTAKQIQKDHPPSHYV